jgi:hypothetical protein
MTDAGPGDQPETAYSGHSSQEWRSIAILTGALVTGCVGISLKAYRQTKEDQLSDRSILAFEVISSLLVIASVFLAILYLYWRGVFNKCLSTRVGKP